MIRTMLRQKACLIVFLLTTISALMFLASAASQITSTTVFILPDGTVSPSSMPIQRNGNTYTFTDNVYDPILVQKSNITIDGAGYTLRGPLTAYEINTQQILGLGPNATITVPYIIGLDFNASVGDVTVKNLNIRNFSIGLYVRTTHNIIVNNAFSDNIVGILLSGSANNITKNYIADNRQGLFFGFEQIDHNAGNIPSDITISDNSFFKNEVQLSGCVCKIYNFSEAKHAWDNGKIGNYWSNYNGTDQDHDGIGDTPYVIDVLNMDNYPLIQSPALPPTVAQAIPAWLIVVLVAVPVATAVTLIFVFRRTRKKSQT
jgi:parallel beta-helix repeat protein